MRHHNKNNFHFAHSRPRRNEWAHTHTTHLSLHIRLENEQFYFWKCHSPTVATVSLPVFVISILPFDHFQRNARLHAFMDGGHLFVWMRIREHKTIICLVSNVRITLFRAILCRSGGSIPFIPGRIDLVCSCNSFALQIEFWHCLSPKVMYTIDLFCLTNTIFRFHIEATHGAHPDRVTALHDDRSAFATYGRRRHMQITSSYRMHTSQVSLCIFIL